VERYLDAEPVQSSHKAVVLEVLAWVGRAYVLVLTEACGPVQIITLPTTVVLGLMGAVGQQLAAEPALDLILVAAVVLQVCVGVPARPMQNCALYGGFSAEFSLVMIRAQYQETLIAVLARLLAGGIQITV
jgi:hypothetical protein